MNNSSGNNWAIITLDNTLGINTELDIADATQFRWAFGGALELYGVTSCNDLPQTGSKNDNFNNFTIILEDNSFRSWPNSAFTSVTQSIPICSWSVTSNSSVITLWW